MSLTLEIITPEKIIYQGEADEVLIPTPKGQIGVLPHHVHLMSKVVHGELAIKKGKQETLLAITGGFLEVSNNKVTILADYAIRSEDIEVAKVQEAKKRAERLMAEKVSKQDYAEIEAQLRRSLLELKVAGKHRTRSAPNINQNNNAP